MKKLIAIVFLISIGSLTYAENRDSSSVTIGLEFSALYSVGIPHSIGLSPKMVVRGKKSEVGIGLVFQQKAFPNPEVVSPSEYSSFVSGLYGFYNHRINTNETNALSLQYRVLFQQSVVFELNEVKYRDTARLISSLDQAIGITFRKKILEKLYFTTGAGVGVISHLNEYVGSKHSIRFGNSNFGLSGMVDFGLMYDIR